MLTSIRQGIKDLRLDQSEVITPEKNIHKLSVDELVLKFSEMLASVGGEAHSLAGEGGLQSALSEILSEFKDKTALIPPDPELKETGVVQIIESAGMKVLYSNETPLEQAAEADIGITTAQAGIADTGTMVLFHTSKRGRLAALLPTVHLAILKKDLLFADKFNYLKETVSQGIDIGATPMTWVTGPSLTADIEKVLVRGAHGPRRVIVLLY